jgi:hypothetical protein
MKHIRLTMINDHILPCPLTPLPRGYHFRFYKTGDKPIWAEIVTQAGEFPTLEAALDRFNQEFSNAEHQLSSRCLILETHFYPLVEEWRPSVLTKYFDRVKKRMNMGRLAITATAIIIPSSL